MTKPPVKKPGLASVELKPEPLPQMFEGRYDKVSPDGPWR